MRRSSAFVALALAAVSQVAGQEPWTASIGIQAGYSRFKPAGTNQPDAIDLYQIPGQSIFDVFGTYGALFAIIPVHNRIAIEPSFRFTQHSPAAFAGTNVVLGARADVAIQKGLYAALGPQLNYVEGGAVGMSDHQFGLNVGVGYRLHLSSVLDGRIEANALFFRKDSVLPPYNVYSLLFGLSGHLPGAAAPAHRGTAAAAPGPRPIWRWAIGAMAGYSRSHAVGGGDFATFSLPGSGAANTSLLTGAPGPATLFAIAPIHQRFAVELGFDFQQENPNAIGGGGKTFVSAQLAPRLNVAVADNWYGAIGAREFIVRISDILKTSAISGLQVAWGYRFDLTHSGSLRGRAELNYSMFATNHTVGSPAFNQLGFLAGVAFPLH